MTHQKRADMAVYQRCNIGVIGDNAHVEGGIHFYGDPSKPPLQLPPKHDHFIGRQEKIDDLIPSLAPVHITALWGPGGIGKSAIASEVLWRLTDNGQRLPDNFPDGVIWYDFYWNIETDKALVQIALIFGVEPKPSPQDAAKRALSGIKAISLLDETEDAENFSKSNWRHGKSGYQNGNAAYQLGQKAGNRGLGRWPVSETV